MTGNIPRDFNELTHQQMIEFARMSFDAYWELFDRLAKNKELNSCSQHISQDVTEIQKLINKLNQEINK